MKGNQGRVSARVRPLPELAEKKPENSRETELKQHYSRNMKDRTRNKSQIGGNVACPDASLNSRTGRLRTSLSSPIRKKSRHFEKNTIDSRIIHKIPKSDTDDKSTPRVVSHQPAGSGAEYPGQIKAGHIPLEESQLMSNHRQNSLVVSHP